MKKFLSASAFAKLIGKNPKTVINWIEKGLIPNVRRIGHRFQIPIEELEKAKTLPEYPPNYVVEEYGQDH
jgi:predicted site-specific integrase-resolvase